MGVGETDGSIYQGKIKVMVACVEVTRRSRDWVRGDGG